MIFNFCAENTIEGSSSGGSLKSSTRCVPTSADASTTSSDKSLSQGGLDFERLLREALLESRARRGRASETSKRSTQRVSRVRAGDRHRTSHQARRHEMGRAARLAFRGAPAHARVRRAALWPSGNRGTGLRLEERRDGEHLLRIEHVPRALRDDRLASVRRLGPPQDHYLKATFRKEARERAEHEDAVLLSPATRYTPPHARRCASGSRRLWRRRALHRALGEGARTRSISSLTRSTAWICAGDPEQAWAELVAVVEDENGPGARLRQTCCMTSPRPTPPRQRLQEPHPRRSRRATNHVRAVVQKDERQRVSEERRQQAKLRSDYLRQSMDAQRDALQEQLDRAGGARLPRRGVGPLARDEAERRMRGPRAPPRRQAGVLRGPRGRAARDL